MTELRSNRFAPDFASLRCATPGERFRLVASEVWASLARMSMDTELQKHYGLLLGVGRPWEVKTVELKLEDKAWRSSWAGNGERSQMPGLRRGSVRFTTARRSGPGGIWTRCSFTP